MKSRAARECRARLGGGTIKLEHAPHTVQDRWMLMSPRDYVTKELAQFEALGDQRLQEDIDAITVALHQDRIGYAADTLIPRLYAKDQEYTLQDMVSAMPEEGFDEPRRLIREGFYRAAAYEISLLINSGLGLWQPSDKDRQIMRAFWDYSCG